MANTSNFGWETPDDTDLVKDGALAIRTLGSAIDTSLVDLKGGTTGQVLAKASNTDMDFTWTSDQVGIPASTVDAKGDLIAGTADNTVSRLAAGTNEYRLVADSGETTGLKYVADTTNYAIAAKGDLLAGTAADTLAALTVGTNGDVLTVDSSTATGLKWAAPAGGGSTFSGVLLTKSGNQSLTNNTLTAITWDTESFDTDSFHSTVTNTSRITIPAGKAGYYRITAKITFAGVTSNTSRQIRIYKNGSADQILNQVATGASSSGDDNGFELNTIMNLAVSDYIEVYAYQLSGGALNVLGNVGFGLPQSIFTVNYLGA